MTEADARHCAKCRYHGTCDNNIICDYIGIVGRSRGCPHGEGCREFAEGTPVRSVPLTLLEGTPVERPKPQEHGYGKQKEKMLARKAMYDAGLNDVQIAAKEGGSSSAVASWRWKSGLPSNWKVRIKTDERDNQHNDFSESEAPAPVAETLGAAPGGGDNVDVSHGRDNRHVRHIVVRLRRR